VILHVAGVALELFRADGATVTPTTGPFAGGAVAHGDRCAIGLGGCWALVIAGDGHASAAWIGSASRMVLEVARVIPEPVRAGATTVSSTTCPLSRRSLAREFHPGIQGGAGILAIYAPICLDATGVDSGFVTNARVGLEGGARVVRERRHRLDRAGTRRRNRACRPRPPLANLPEMVFLMRLGRKDERTTNEPKGRDEQELGSFHQKRLSTSKPVLCRPTTGTTNSACEEPALRLRHQSRQRSRTP